MTARTLIYSEMRKEVNMAHIFMMFIGKFVLSLVILRCSPYTSTPNSKVRNQQTSYLERGESVCSPRFLP